MRPIPILLAAVLLMGSSSAACAAEEETPARTQEPTADEQPAPRVGCPQETGTRIKRKNGRCDSSPGRVYGADELRLTGQTNVGEALQRLDSSVGR